MGENKLRRKLGFWAALGGTMGLVVSGTAMVSVGAVAASAGSAAWISALIGLIPMIAVACAYGELTAMFPGGGMTSDYTMPTLGKFWSVMSILLGYILLIACDGGTQQIVGALAIEQVTGISYIPITIVMLILVICIHLFGVQFYGRIETALTLIMMAIFLIIAIAAFFGAGEAAGVAEVINEPEYLNPENGWGPVFMAAGNAIWWYIGFEFICPMAEENKSPHRNIPRALLLGLIIIFIADVLFAQAAVKYTDLSDMASSSTPHIVAATAMLGNIGAVITIIITVLAAFTSAIAHMAALPRMLYGMAKKNLAPKAFAYIHPKYRTPWVGIFFTAFLMTITIIFMMIYGTDVSVILMLVNIACCTWIMSYIIAVVDVIILRKKHPDFPRLWKAPACIPLMVIGLIGLGYCLWTYLYIWIPVVIAVAVFALYTIIWLKTHNMSLSEKNSVIDMVKDIRERTELLPEWDEAVNEWISKQE